MEDLENHIVNYTEKSESDYEYDDYCADRCDEFYERYKEEALCDSEED